MKKIILAILSSLLLASPASASLFSYYGGHLPSIQLRARQAFNCGIPNYAGTMAQNIQLERCLRFKTPLKFSQGGFLGGVGTGMKYVQSQYFTLAGSGALQGATTMVLKKFQQINGTNLTITDFGTQGFGTLEPNSGTSEEQVVFTGVTQNANGTATLTGLSTVLTVYPYTKTSGLAQTHAGGVKFVLSNTAGFYDTFTNKLNDETVSGTYTFILSPIVPTPTANNQAVNKSYADALSIAGSPTSTENSLGQVQLAVGLQIASSTASSTAGAPLVVGSKWTTSTPGGQVGVGFIPATQNNGRINGAFFDGSYGYSFNASTTFSASSTFTASTTLSKLQINGATAINGNSVRFPSAVGASSTVMKNDGNGNLIWDREGWGEIFSTTTPIATTTINFPVPGNVSDIEMFINIGSGGSANTLGLQFNNDRAGDYGARSYINGVMETSDGLGRSQLEIQVTGTTTPQYYDVHIHNDPGNFKMPFWTGVLAGNSTAGSFINGAGIWQIANAPITNIQVMMLSAGTMPAGTTVVVYGGRQ